MGINVFLVLTNFVVFLTKKLGKKSWVLFLKSSVNSTNFSIFWKKNLQSFYINLFYLKTLVGGMGKKISFKRLSFLSFIDAKTFELICTTRRGKKKKRSWGKLQQSVALVHNFYSNLHFSCMVECKANVGCHFQKKE